MSHEPLDLLHCGDERRIGAYLVETDDGLALFDCGPTSCLAALHDALGRRGVELRDVKHLLLSHIHLDHAGAAGALVREHPALAVHVSEVGAPHIVDPSRLEASARRLYGDSFDDLWGELVPVPEENVHVVGDRVVGLACFPTPGHAWHQVSYQHEDGTLYNGDAAGVRIDPGRFVFAPTPPPEIDLDAWERTIGRDRAALAAAARARALRRLRRRRAPPGCAARDDAQLGRQGRPRDGRADLHRRRAGGRRRLRPRGGGRVDRAAPYWHCYLGLERYWRKRLEALQAEAREATPRVEGLERIALAAYLPVYGDDAVAIGEAVCLRAPHAPDSPMLNRVVGLGLGAQVEEATLDRCLAAMADTTFYVAVAPSADPRLVALSRRTRPGAGLGLDVVRARPRARPARRDGARRRRRSTPGGRRSGPSSSPPPTGCPTPLGPSSRPCPRFRLDRLPRLDGDEPAAAAAVWIGGRQRTSDSPRRSPSTGARVGRERCSPRGSSRPGRPAAATLVTETGELREGTAECVLSEHLALRLRGAIRRGAPAAAAAELEA